MIFKFCYKYENKKIKPFCENLNNSKVVKVWFKYKEGGWKTSPKRTRLDFKNGNFKIKDGNITNYGRKKNYGTTKTL